MSQALDPIILESIRIDLEQVGEQLRELARRIIDEGISEYPVFIASDEMVDIGKAIFDRDLVQVNWFYHVSILEDFVRKGIIQREKLANFRRAYDDPMQKACILVITADSTQVVFVPYPESSGDPDESTEDLW